MRRPSLAVLFMTVFLDLVGFGIVIPLLPFYAESFLAGESERAQAALVGVLMASYSAMQFVFAPVWGRLSDRVGRRPVILASVAGSVASLTAFALASSFAWLLAARAFAGVAGANVAAAQAYVADVTTPENRARGMGTIGAAFGLGFIVGPAIGGFFGQWGFAAPAFVAAGLSAVNLALAIALLPESLPAGGPARPAARWSVFDLRRIGDLAARPAVLGLVALGFLVTTAFSMMEATFGLWSEDAHGFDATRTGYLFAFLGVVIATVQGGLVGPLSRRLGERRLLLAGISGMGVGLALLPVTASTPALYGVAGLLAFSNALANPSLLTLLSFEAAADEQGGALGLAQSLSSLARVVGPVYGGFALGTIGLAAPFLTGALGMLLALALATVVIARLPPRPRAAPREVP